MNLTTGRLPKAVRGLLRSRLASPSSRMALAAMALVTLSAAMAQDPEPRLGSFLPDTTVAAFHFTPGSTGHGFLEALASDLDLEAAGATVAKLGRVIGDEFGEDFGAVLESGLHGMMGGSLDGLTAELTEDCPALHDLVTGGELGALVGPTVLGVSMSSYNPMPGALLVTRPADRAQADSVYDALVGCYDAGVSLKQDDVELHLFADGSDQPVLVARVDGTFMASTDQDLLRASVRLAAGSAEPSHISHRVGSLAAGPMGRGVGMTLDLAALADALEGLRGFVPLEEPFVVIVDRVLASMRVVNGVAVSARIDEAGLAIESLLTLDEAAAQDTGETALFDLLTCAGCTSGGPAMIPAGAASVWAGTFSGTQLVAWLDSWLADLSALGVGDLSVTGLVSEYLGSDLEETLLAWIGTGWHTAQLDVYDTDMRSWLNSPATVGTMPVSDEAAARRAIAQWPGVVRTLTGLGADVMTDFGGMPPDLEDEAGAALANLDMLSVQPGSYRGVPYERWRFGPLTDSALAVFGGHLVWATPYTAIERAIDVYLGAPSVTSDQRLGPIIAGQPSGATAYQVIDVPRYLRGFAEVTDLASAPFATGLQVAMAAGLERDDEAGRESVAPEDIPSFDELLNLTDLGTEVLRALAARTGIAVGTTEHVGGVIWTTWRLPLRQ